MADGIALPPWLTPRYDPVEAWQRAFATGAQISEAQSRLAEQQRQANMDYQARQEQLQANILRAQADLEVKKEYDSQTLALHQAQLAETQRRNTAMADKAASDLAERMAYHNALIASRTEGKDYGDIQFGEVPGFPNAITISRPGSPGLHVLKSPEEKKARVTVKDVATGETYSSTADDPGIEAFKKAHGMSATPTAIEAKKPFSLTDPSSWFSKSKMVAAPPAPATGRIRVKSPDGKIGTIPASQRKEAEDAGYTILE